MTEFRPGYGILAGTQFCKMNAAWKLQTAAKIASHMLLILKGRWEIDFESNTCLT